MQKTSPKGPLKELRRDFAVREVLNRHGYAFQEAVVAKTGQLYSDKKSRWIFEVAEFPVQSNGRTTRVDFVLSREHRFLVAECKRVNPAFAWFFARSGYVRRDYSESELLVESVTLGDEGLETSKSRLTPGSSYIYHISRPFKTNAEGDAQGGRDRDAIEEACGQVFLGTNGFVECLGANPRLMRDRTAVTVVPAIFTTASLFTTDVDLGAVDGETGKLGINSRVDLEERDWIWLRYNVSPTTRHSLPRGEDRDASVLGGSLSRFLDEEYARSVAIVNWKGIQSFLAAGIWQ